MNIERGNIMTQEEAESLLWTTATPGVPLFMNNTLFIAPERLEEFETALREVLPHARAEQCCLYLHAGQDVTDPTVFVLSEGWSDLMEYRDVVMRKDYFQRYLATSTDAYAQPRRVTLLSPFDESVVTE